MKQLILLGSKEPGSKNNVGVLAQSLQAQGLEAQTRVCYLEDMVFCIATHTQSVIDSVSQTDFASADLVIAMNWYKSGAQAYYRDMAFTLALYLQKAGVAFWNSEMLHQRSSTKLSALLQLAQAGIDVPETVFSLNPAALRDASDMDFPLIVKTIAGSRGSKNYLAESAAELERILTADGGKTPFMVEEFIPNDHDLRIVCYGGEPVLAIKRRRTSNATHLNNTSQGASAEVVPLKELEEAALAVCRKACELLGREVAGVDILFASDGSRRMVCLEVNAIPQLTSGSYVSDKATSLARTLNEYLKGSV
ncbi:MAG TPA: hypothetical protein VLE99_03320 [Candidatus Saccharimonadales bacterium]|nr:hypothetical protein [Candidatus Saccharimonadales bacterium]